MRFYVAKMVLFTGREVLSACQHIRVVIDCSAELVVKASLALGDGEERVAEVRELAEKGVDRPRHGLRLQERVSGMSLQIKVRLDHTWT